MCAVEHRRRVAPEREQQCILAVQDLTRAMRRASGSHGSPLHRGHDGEGSACARWPDAAARARCCHGQDDARRRLRDTRRLLDEWAGELESGPSSEGRPAPSGRTARLVSPSCRRP